MTFPKPKFQRELRLGLVVYGGVSLAVYMNGICREFYNAVRGRGVYKLVKALTDSDLIVDIISGTSAGGINGILLGYALANSSTEEVVDFETFASIWRESGNIRKLLHQPDEKVEGRDSLFDGEGYYQNELESAFQVAQQGKKPAEPDEWYSAFNELDLFVTGTDLLGRVYSTFDETGAVIEVKDHRALFHLKHRQGRKTPFSPQSLSDRVPHQALAKLCRITSCFPVAFPPVNVKLKEAQKTADSYLEEWGVLNNRLLPNTAPAEGYELHFVDGGVLDNRPFSHTIKEIYFRMANRPVDRKLVYIDPNPERFSDSPLFKEMQKPNVLQIVEDSLVGMPRYESITNDLELIKERNEKVRRYNALLADAEIPINFSENANAPREGQQNLQEGIYWLSRLVSLRDRVLPLILGINRTHHLASSRDFTQRQTLLEQIAQLLIQPISQRGNTESQKNLRLVSEQICDLDIEYSLRQHFYILDKLHLFLERVRNLTEYPKIRLLVERINRQVKLLEIIRTALERLLNSPVVTAYFEELVKGRSPEEDDDSFRNRVYFFLVFLHQTLLEIEQSELSVSGEYSSEGNDGLFAFFQGLPERACCLTVPEQYEQLSLEVTEWLPQKELSNVLAKFQQKIAKIESMLERKTGLEVPVTLARPGVSFLRKVEAASEALLQNSHLKNADYLTQCFQNFSELDEVLYPFEYLTDIVEKQPINTIRISPKDAQLGFGKGKGLDEKLAGNALSAFGGFFKKSWRANDILWGRLDGANRLLEASLTPESLARFPRFLRRQAREAGIDENTPEFEQFRQEYCEFLLEASFPHCKPSDRAKLLTHLNLLATPHLQLSSEQLEAILNDFVLEAQRDILHGDLLSVIEDEISEQIDWNYQTTVPNDIANREVAKVDYLQNFFKNNAKPRYNLERGYFEKNVSVLAAAAIARESLANLRGNEEDYFRTKYRVGQETITDNIPPLILTNLATRSALVFRDLLNAVLGGNARRFRRSVPYQFINRGLQLFYQWLQFKGPFALESPGFRRQPQGRVVVQLLQFIIFLIIIICVIFIAMNSPQWVVAAVIFWLLGWLLGRRDER